MPIVESSQAVPKPTALHWSEGGLARRFPWLSHMHTEGEEWVNGLIHAVGGVLAMMGAVFLLGTAGLAGNFWYFGSCAVYVASLVSVFAASALSHWVAEPGWRHHFRAWDQGLIFLLIVATFTPLSVAYLPTVWGSFTAVLWILAIAGFVSKVGYGHCVEDFAVWFQLTLGWLPILAMPTIWGIAPIVVGLLLVGGVLYTIGTALLMNDHRGPYLHACWHLLVITASGFHFVAIYRFVAPV